MVPEALVAFMEACRRGEALGLFESMAADMGVARAMLGTGLADPDSVSDERRSGASSSRWCATSGPSAPSSAG